MLWLDKIHNGMQHPDSSSECLFCGSCSADIKLMFLMFSGDLLVVAKMDNIKNSQVPKNQYIKHPWPNK
jgi:hypothetical protein